MIISHAHRFIFLKTQKCAGTSVEMALSMICGPDDVVSSWGAVDAEQQHQVGCEPRNIEIPLAYRPYTWQLRQLMRLRTAHRGVRYHGHMSASKIRQSMDARLFDAYRKVTIVRNPWDREVSLYFWHYRDNENRPPFERYVRLPRYRPERKTFDLYSIDGRIVADTILRYENLQDDYSNFVKSLGVDVPPELPRAKGKFRPQSKRNYRDLYSTTTRDVVARRYAREIEAFGYQF